MSRFERWVNLIRSSQDSGVSQDWWRMLYIYILVRVEVLHVSKDPWSFFEDPFPKVSPNHSPLFGEFCEFQSYMREFQDEDLTTALDFIDTFHPMMPPKVILSLVYGVALRPYDAQGVWVCSFLSKNPSNDRLISPKFDPPHILSAQDIHKQFPEVREVSCERTYEGPSHGYVTSRQIPFHPKKGLLCAPEDYSSLLPNHRYFEPHVVISTPPESSTNFRCKVFWDDGWVADYMDFFPLIPHPRIAIH